MANIIACETKLKSIKKTHTALESPGVQTATFKNKLDNYLRFQTKDISFCAGAGKRAGFDSRPSDFRGACFIFATSLLSESLAQANLY